MYGSKEERQSLIDICLKMEEKKLNAGSAGNASLKIDGGILITPSGVNYHKMKPEDIVFMDYEQKYYGELLPSSEWHFHLAIQKNRPDIKAVLHAHSPWSMVVACALKDIPAVHYMIGVAKANRIICSPYRPFGTSELSDVAIKALGEAMACLLGNHGIVTVGETFDKAIHVMQEVEQLAQIYVLSQNLGGANILSDEEMEDVHAKFKSYGKQLDELNESEMNMVMPIKAG